MSDEKDSQDDEISEPNSEPPAVAKPKSAGSARRKSAPVAQKGAAAGGMLVVVALAAGAAGAAGGWFGHDAQAKAKLRAESAAAPAGSAGVSGPCGAWQTKICAGAGDNSAACAEAKSAVDLLTPSACDAALVSVPATLAKVKAERATCDKLITKLCADLPPGSQTCEMVRERTPSFPRERCEGMLAHYDEVIGGLKQMEQQAGAQPGGMPMGAAPPGAGVPPMGAMPHIQVQPGPASGTPPAHP